MSKIIVDQSSRDKIKNQFHTNFLVEAGAGSGKTTSLVERMVNLIYTGTSKIEQMVAITFTRKAADELKVRFQSELEKSWRQEENEDKRVLLSEALQNIERCFLGTVHSFCAQLLRERPIEANIDLSFKELEETEDLELLDEAWRVYLAEIEENNPEQMDAIDKLGIAVDELFQCLRDMKDYPDVNWITASDLAKPDLKTPFETFMRLVKEAKKAIPEREPEKGYDSLQKALLQAVQKERFIDVEKEKDLLAVLALFDKKLKATQNRWDSKEDAKFYEEKISATFDDLIKPQIQAWKEYSHPIITSFLQGAINEYTKIKNERSLLNFQDLLIRATALLQANSDVRSYFQEKYRFLLVDEFQDTDPVQAELMFYLTGEDIHEKVWSKCKPRAGTLFVVGDPKQAIYRFRRADIDTYNRVKELIVAHGGEVLQLTMNFRTLDCITNQLNLVFQTYLPEQETPFQAAFRPLNSYHQDDGKRWTGIKKLVVASEYSKKDEIIAADAHNIAYCIQEQLKQGYKAKDFMVLTRYNDGIEKYAEAIEALHIPVSISGEVIIGETKEFQELRTLLKAFVDPSDSLNLVAVLRGVFFGFSDNDLYQWKKGKGQFSMYSHIPEGLPLPIKSKFDKTFRKLRMYQNWVRSFSPTVAIEKMIEDVGFYPLLIKNNRSKRTYKSLIQIISSLRKYESAGQTTFKEIFEQLSRFVLEKTVVLNIEEEADAVRVMNVHKAKGLEAPVVFLAHPAKAVKPEAFVKKHIKREGYYSEGYITFSIRKGFQDHEVALPIGWKELKEKEILYLTEEEVHIIYVAATRAEQTLILSSSAKNNSKNPWNMLLGLDTIEEIETGEMEELKNNATEVVNLDEYLEKTSSISAWLEEGKKKTYDYWSPTKDKDYATVSTIERVEGGGLEWGTIVHEVLEKSVKGYDVTRFIQSILHKYQLPLNKEDELIEIVRKFQNSSIWQDLMTADEVHVEIPFAGLVLKDEPLYQWFENAEAEKMIMKGVIDLVYKTKAGWVIVDYKTDRPTHYEDFQKLSDFYSSQIQFYQTVWEKFTNEKIVESKLYFVYQ